MAQMKYVSKAHRMAERARLHAELKRRFPGCRRFDELGRCVELQPELFPVHPSFPGAPAVVGPGFIPTGGLTPQLPPRIGLTVPPGYRSVVEEGPRQETAERGVTHGGVKGQAVTMVPMMGSPKVTGTTAMLPTTDVRTLPMLAPRGDMTLTTISSKPGMPTGIFGKGATLPAGHVGPVGVPGGAAHALPGIVAAAAHGAVHGFEGPYDSVVVEGRVGDPVLDQRPYAARPAPRKRMRQQATPAGEMNPYAQRLLAARRPRVGSALTSNPLFGLDAQDFAGRPERVVDSQGAPPPLSRVDRFAQVVKGQALDVESSFTPSQLFGVGDLVATLEGMDGMGGIDSLGALLSGGPLDGVLESALFGYGGGLGDAKAEATVSGELKKTRAALSVAEQKEAEGIRAVEQLDRQILALKNPVAAAARKGDEKKIEALLNKLAKLDAARKIAAARTIRYAKAKGAAALIARNLSTELTTAKLYKAAVARGDKTDAARLLKAFKFVAAKNKKIKRLRKKARKKWAAKTASERAGAAKLLREQAASQAAEAARQAAEARMAQDAARIQELEQKLATLQEAAAKLKDQEEAAVAQAMKLEAESQVEEEPSAEETEVESEMEASGEMAPGESEAEEEMPSDEGMSGYEIGAVYGTLLGGLASDGLAGALGFSFTDIFKPFTAIGEFVKDAVVKVADVSRQIGCAVVSNPAVSQAASQHPKAMAVQMGGNIICEQINKLAGEGKIQRELKSVGGQAAQAYGAGRQLVQQGRRTYSQARGVGRQLQQGRLPPGIIPGLPGFRF